MLRDLLEKTIHQLRDVFYERLLQGKIREAQLSVPYLATCVADIQPLLNEIASSFAFTDTIERERFTTLQQNCSQAFLQWRTCVEHELNSLTDQDFQEDPKGWQAILHDTFEQPTNDFLMRVQELLLFIQQLEKEKKEGLEPSIYSEEYRKRKERINAYATHQEEINRVEAKIFRQIARRDFSQPKITGRILTGRWAGYLHAHLPKPLNDHRIVYSLDGKKILFWTIGTHKELAID